MVAPILAAGARVAAKKVTQNGVRKVQRISSRDQRRARERRTRDRYGRLNGKLAEINVSENKQNTYKEINRQRRLFLRRGWGNKLLGKTSGARSHLKAAATGYVIISWSLAALIIQVPMFIFMLLAATVAEVPVIGAVLTGEGIWTFSWALITAIGIILWLAATFLFYARGIHALGGTHWAVKNGLVIVALIGYIGPHYMNWAPWIIPWVIYVMWHPE